MTEFEQHLKERAPAAAGSVRQMYETFFLLGQASTAEQISQLQAWLDNERKEIYKRDEQIAKLEKKLEIAKSLLAIAATEAMELSDEQMPLYTHPAPSQEPSLWVTTGKHPTLYTASSLGDASVPLYTHPSNAAAQIAKLEAENADLQLLLNTIVNIPNMSNEQLTELNANAREAIKAAPKGEER